MACMSKSAIARTEDVSKTVVGEAIAQGLRNMEKFLKKYL